MTRRRRRTVLFPLVIITVFMLVSCGNIVLLAQEEPGPTIDAARILELPADVYEDLMPSGDVDVYQFTLDELSEVIIDVIAESMGELDTVLDVLDSDGDTLRHIDDIHGTDPYLEVVLLPGVYYARISGVNSVASSAYRLAIQTSPVATISVPMFGMGVISPVGGIDAFQFRIDAIATVTIDVDTDESESTPDFYFALLDADLHEVFWADDVDGRDPYMQRELEPGTYIWVIQGVQPSTGPYSVTISVEGLGDSEPQASDAKTAVNDVPDATRITLPYTGQHAIDFADDFDRFSFSINELIGVHLDIDTSSISSTLDTVMRLLDAQGNKLAFNDDDQGLDAGILLALEPGHYVVQIAGYAGSTGAYILSVRTTVAPAEPGDDPNTGVRVDLPFIGKYDISPADDKDWFVFYLEQPAGIFIDIDAYEIDSYLNAFLTLIDNDGNTIATSDADYALDPRIEMSLDAGLYYVEVSSPQGITLGNYTLRIELK